MTPPAPHVSMAARVEQVNGVDRFHDVGGRTLICEEERDAWNQIFFQFQMCKTSKQWEHNTEAGRLTDKQLQTHVETQAPA